MKLTSLTAIGSIDGRYRNKAEELAPYFSEAALIGHRTYMEIQYLLALVVYAETHGIIRVPPLTNEQKATLEFFRDNTAFTPEYAVMVKVIERKTNHDVKAVEYAIRDFLQQNGFPKEFIAHCHFGLTSEDVNNIAYAHMLHKANNEVLILALEEVINTIHDLAHKFSAAPLLARTHGQPATPTTFGKEMMIFKERLAAQLDQLRGYKISVKLNGASGNYNGHAIAYPEVNWPQFVQEFIDRSYKDSLDEKPIFRVNHWTNQIEDHDTYAELFAIYSHINTIFKKFCKDIWLYISRDLVALKKVEGEVGSSAMPHKVNPIDFENAEGNLECANALFEMFCRKLPDSRLQRDLSDSTIERNFGVAFSHCLIAYKAIEKGLSKIAPNIKAMEDEVNSHPEVLAEAYQLVLKVYGYGDAYEIVKERTRGQQVTLEALHALLEEFEIPEHQKQKLKALTPATYLGFAPKLAKGFDIVDLNYMLRDI